MIFELTELAKEFEQTYTIDFTPKRNNPLDAGLDLRICNADYTYIHPGDVIKVGTGLKLSLLDDIERLNLIEGCTLFAMVLPRSSCKGWKLENTAGIIDATYTGEIFMKIRNTGTTSIVFEPFEYIAQYIVLPCFLPKPIRGVMPVTDRGEKGDGSSGKV